MSVCIGCGLCCDGTILGHLAVADESDLGAPLRALGVELLVAADPPVFELPCPAVVEGRCTVHHLHRPRACAQFECSVSRAVLEGVMSAEEAGAVIDSTRRDREAVEAGELDDGAFQRRLDRDFRWWVTRAE